MPLANYVALLGRVPYTYTSASTFPTSPQQGDQHFLTEDIYPTATATNPMDVSRTQAATGSGLQALENIRVNDPDNNSVICGTVEVRADNTPNPNMDVSETVSGVTTHIH